MDGLAVHFPLGNRGPLRKGRLTAGPVSGIWEFLLAIHLECPRLVLIHILPGGQVHPVDLHRAVFQHVDPQGLGGNLAVCRAGGGVAIVRVHLAALVLKICPDGAVLDGGVAVILIDGPGILQGGVGVAGDVDDLGILLKQRHHIFLGSLAIVAFPLVGHIGGVGNAVVTHDGGVYIFTRGGLQSGFHHVVVIRIVPAIVVGAELDDGGNQTIPRTCRGRHGTAFVVVIDNFAGILFSLGFKPIHRITGIVKLMVAHGQLHLAGFAKFAGVHNAHQGIVFAVGAIVGHVAHQEDAVGIRVDLVKCIQRIGQLFRGVVIPPNVGVTPHKEARRYGFRRGFPLVARCIPGQGRCG